MALRGFWVLKLNFLEVPSIDGSWLGDTFVLEILISSTWGLSSVMMITSKSKKTMPASCPMGLILICPPVFWKLTMSARKLKMLPCPVWKLKKVRAEVTMLGRVVRQLRLMMCPPLIYLWLMPLTVPKVVLSRSKRMYKCRDQEDYRVQPWLDSPIWQTVLEGW